MSDNKGFENSFSTVLWSELDSFFGGRDCIYCSSKDGLIVKTIEYQKRTFCFHNLSKNSLTTRAPYVAANLPSLTDAIKKVLTNNPYRKIFENFCEVSSPRKNFQKQPPEVNDVNMATRIEISPTDKSSSYRKKWPCLIRISCDLQLKIHLKISRPSSKI